MQFAKRRNHIGYPRIPDVRAILLKRKSQHQNSRFRNRYAAQGHEAHDAIGDMTPHRIIDAPPGENNFRVVSDLLSAMRQIIRIDSDTMAADQPWLEGHKIPFRSRR